MIKRIYPDRDSKLIWLDQNDYTPEELNQLVLSSFDVLNIQKDFYEDKITKYFITFFDNPKSSTGYAAIFMNKDKTIYKSKIGYEI